MLLYLCIGFSQHSQTFGELIIFVSLDVVVEYGYAVKESNYQIIYTTKYRNYFLCLSINHFFIVLEWYNIMLFFMIINFLF